MCGRFPPRNHQHGAAHGGVYQKLHAESPDLLLIHLSLLLPLEGMINSLAQGFQPRPWDAALGQGTGLSGIGPLSHYVLLHGEKFVWKSWS